MRNIEIEASIREAEVMAEEVQKVAVVKVRGQKLITVGTDCSGLEAPLHALQQRGVPYEHVFSSEICATTREQLFNFGDKKTPWKPPHAFATCSAATAALIF